MRPALGDGVPVFGTPTFDRSATMRLTDFRRLFQGAALAATIAAMGAATPGSAAAQTAGDTTGMSAQTAPQTTARVDDDNDDDTDLGWLGLLGLAGLLGLRRRDRVHHTERVD